MNGYYEHDAVVKFWHCSLSLSLSFVRNVEAEALNTNERAIHSFVRPLMQR